MNAWLILGSSLRLKTQGSIGSLTAHNKIPRKVQWYSFLPRVGGLRYLWFSSLAVGLGVCSTSVATVSAKMNPETPIFPLFFGICLKL